MFDKQINQPQSGEPDPTRPEHADPAADDHGEHRHHAYRQTKGSRINLVLAFRGDMSTVYASLAFARQMVLGIS